MVVAACARAAAARRRPRPAAAAGGVAIRLCQAGPIVCGAAQAAASAASGPSASTAARAGGCAAHSVAPVRRRPRSRRGFAAARQMLQRREVGQHRAPGERGLPGPRASRPTTSSTSARQWPRSVASMRCAGLSAAMPASQGRSDVPRASSSSGANSRIVSMRRQAASSTRWPWRACRRACAYSRLPHSITAALRSAPARGRRPHAAAPPARSAVSGCGLSSCSASASISATRVASSRSNAPTTMRMRRSVRSASARASARAVSAMRWTSSSARSDRVARLALGGEHARDGRLGQFVGRAPLIDGLHPLALHRGTQSLPCCDVAASAVRRR